MPNFTSKEAQFAAHIATQIRPVGHGNVEYSREAQAFDDFCNALSIESKRTGVRMGAEAEFRSLGMNGHTLLIQIRGLQESIQKNDLERGGKQLAFLEKKLQTFAADYAKLKTRCPEVFRENPALARFDEIWEKGSFTAGQSFLDRVNGVIREEAPQQAEEEDDLDSPLNINEVIVENQRQSNQLNLEYELPDVFAANNSSYNGVLGDCERRWKNRKAEPIDPGALVSRALAAAQLRREGVPFNREQLSQRATQIRNAEGFENMIENPRFVSQTLLNPLKIDDALKLYEQEVQLGGRLAQRPTNYKDFLRKNTWPNVPAGFEKECLARAVAAHRLQAQGKPFNAEEILDASQQLLNSKAFKALTTDGEHPKANEYLTRWLNQDQLGTADSMIAELQKSIDRPKVRRNEAPKVNRRPRPQPAALQNPSPTARKANELLKELPKDNPYHREACYRLAALLPEEELEPQHRQKLLANNTGADLNITVLVSDLRKRNKLDLAELAERGPALIALARAEARQPGSGFQGDSLARQVAGAYGYVLKSATTAEKQTPGYQKLQTALRSINQARWTDCLEEKPRAQESQAGIEQELAALTQAKSGFFLPSTNTAEHNNMTAALTKLTQKLRLMRGEEVEGLRPEEKQSLEQEDLHTLFKIAQRNTYEYCRLKTKNGTSSSFVHNVGTQRYEAARRALNQLDNLDMELKIQDPAEKLLFKVQNTVLEHRSDKAWMAQHGTQCAAQMVYALGVMNKSYARDHEQAMVSGMNLSNGITKVGNGEVFKRMVAAEGSKLADRMVEGVESFTNAYIKAADAPKAAAERRDPRQMTATQKNELWKNQPGLN